MAASRPHAASGLFAAAAAHSASSLNNNRLGIYDCSWHLFTASQCVLKCAILTVSSVSNRLAEILRGDFCHTPGLGLRELAYGFLLA